MSRVFVAGGGGYIGVPLCESLLSKGHEVIVLDRFFFGRAKLGSLLDHPRFLVKEADIRDFDPALLTGVDGVVDLAGLSTDAAADIDPGLTRSINNEGGLRLAFEAKKQGVRRYIYSSSAAVYGAGNRQGLTESDECRPQTLYARSKVEMEEDLRRLEGNGFELVIMRNSTVFGVAPRMRFDLSVNGMTLRAVRHNDIWVRGGGQQWRPFVHVRDVVRAFVLALEADGATVAGEVFNIGSNHMNYRVVQIAEFVAEAFPDVTVHNNDQVADLLSYNLCFDKIATRLGFDTTISVPDGIAEVRKALQGNLVSDDDPTCSTADWYRSLIGQDPRTMHPTLASAAV